MSQSDAQPFFEESGEKQARLRDALEGVLRTITDNKAFLEKMKELDDPETMGSARRNEIYDAFEELYWALNSMDSGLKNTIKWAFGYGKSELKSDKPEFRTKHHFDKDLVPLNSLYKNNDAAKDWNPESID